MQVSLNVYDVTNTANDNTNVMITRLNNITRDLNFGGVFHGAIQIEEAEWSFGYCESGTGVYCCRARTNSLYTFREHIELGVTSKTKQEIREILTRYKRTWPGTSYDLLKRNCCHFCEELCVALEVPSPPAWLNRFAQGADATLKFTNDASELAKRVSSNLSITAQNSAQWLRDVSARVMSQISLPASAAGESGSGSDTGSSGDEYDDDGRASTTGGVSPLFGRQASPGYRSEPGGRQREGRIASSRMRPFGGGPVLQVGGGGGGGGLPASTPASSGDLAAASAPQQQQHDARATSPSPSGTQQKQPFSVVLKQKWAELEASAGNGTKQFLFGLIKTRQSRLEEDDLSFGSGSGSGVAAAAASKWEGHASLLGPGGGGGSVAAAPAAAAGPEGTATATAGYFGNAHGRPLSPPEPTLAPPLQVIGKSLLPTESITLAGGATVQTASPAAGPANTDWDAVSWMAGPQLAAAAAGGTSVQQVQAAVPPPPPPPPATQHLLDM